MENNQLKIIETELWKYIDEDELSPSHGRDHIEDVIRYAFQLQSRHGGDKEVILAASILHDLGRTDPNKSGSESIKLSLDKAIHILKNLDDIILTDEKKELALLAIKEHDNYEIRPSTIEGIILKEADFLAGFGSKGILRIAMWAGETRKGLVQILDRLNYRMKKRIKSLELPESILLAAKENTIVNLFIASLEKTTPLQVNKSNGYYIVLEGISGTGKSTQSKEIKRELDKQGYNTEIISEPGEDYKKLYRSVWEKKYKTKLDDKMLMRYLLLADRYQLLNNKLNDKLENNDIIISVRSFISTLVYQSIDDIDIAELNYIHRIFPMPDLIILYDIDVEEAYDRIKSRRVRGLYESIEQMENHKSRYDRVIEDHLIGYNIKRINASKSRENVTNETLKSVMQLLSKH